MRKLAALLVLAGLAGIDARAEDPSLPPANSRTCALVAVFPDQFHVAYETRASFFVAPYSYVSIVILDPGTLAVLEREQILDHQKLYDPQAGTLDLGQNIPKDVLAGQVVHVIERSVASAIARTELAGKVEIREVREVKTGPSPPAPLPRGEGSKP